MDVTQRFGWGGRPPSGKERVTGLLERARHEARSAEPSGGQQTVAAMVAAAAGRRAASVPQAAPRRFRWGVRVALGVGLLAVLLGTGMGLAAGGALPAPLQNVMHDGLEHVGVHVPHGSPHHPTPTHHGHSHQ